MFGSFQFWERRRFCPYFRLCLGSSTKSRVPKKPRMYFISNQNGKELKTRLVNIKGFPGQVLQDTAYGTRMQDTFIVCKHGSESGL